MDHNWFQLILSVVNMVVTAAIWLYIRTDNKQRATVDSIKQLERDMLSRCDEKCAKLARLEGELKTIPTREQFDQQVVRIHERIDEINQNTRNTALMIGELMGYVKQQSERR